MDIGKRRVEAYKKAQQKNASQSESESAPRNSPGGERRGGDRKPNDPKRSAGSPSRTAENARSGAGGLPQRDTGAVGLFKAGRGERGYRKAAEFLILLGSEEAAEVLKHLGEEEVERVTREIAQIQTIRQDEAYRVMDEFGEISRRRPDEDRETRTGGADIAREMLVRAFGEDTGSRVFRKAVPLREKPFAFLAELDIPQVMFLLRGESPAVISVILAFSDRDFSAAVLKSLSRSVQKEVVLRLAKMQKVRPAVIVKIEESLREKVRTMGTSVSEKVDGKAVLAEILKYADGSSERKILDDIRSVDPGLSGEIEELLFTPQVILQVDDQSLQMLLREVSDEDIAILLKGKADDIRQKILSNISERRRSLVLEEYRQAGAVKRSKVDEVTRAFLDRLRRSVEEGTILIFGEDDTIIR